MIFLLEYDRSAGRIVRFEAFSDTERPKAEGLRLDREVELKGNEAEREVVLLDAENEDALRKTHRRYFEDPDGIANTARTPNS